MYKAFAILCFLTTLLAMEDVSARQQRVLFEEGNKVSATGQLKKILDDPDSESLRSSLIKYYSSLGYFSSEIMISGDSVSADLGCLYGLNISFSAEMKVPDNISEIPESYNSQKIERYINRLISGLQREGYYFAGISISGIDIDKENCSVSLTLEQKDLKRIYANDIVLNGTDEDEEIYLKKMIGIKDSLLITPAALQQLQRDLVQTEWFLEVTEPQVYQIDNGYAVLVDLQKQPFSNFEGLLGYVPDPETGRGQIVGDIDLRIRNAVSLGNEIDFTYKRIRPESSELDISLSQRRIADLPFGLSGRFFFFQNDTTYQARNLELGMSYDINPGFRLFGNIDFQKTTQGNDLPTITEPDGTKRTATLGFRISDTDNNEVPTLGGYLELRFGRSYKQFESDSLQGINQNILSASAGKYIPLTNKTVLALSLRSYLVDSELYTIHDLIRFGGANSLRGYSEQQFRASFMTWGDAELRFLTDRFSYLFVFASAGGYRRPELLNEADNSFEQNEFLYSTGFGLSYRTAIGRIKFSYAISPQDPIANGKVHIGFITDI